MANLNISSFDIKHIRPNWHGIILAVITCVIFFVPLVFWGKLYLAGGDDTRLYYIFPWEYLKNFSFNVISNNTLGGNIGYLPMSFSAPTILFLALLKTVVPQINTQLISYGLILSIGFISLNLFFRMWVSKKTTFTLIAGVLASLSYLFSPFVGKTFFQHQQISIFLLMVVPTMFYFFFQGVTKRNMSFVLISTLMYTLFGSGVLSAPWFFPVVLTSIPLFLFLAVKEGWYALKALGVFICITILLNAFWIIHMIIPLFRPADIMNFAQSLSRATYRQQNIDLITTLSGLNSPVNQILGIIRTSWSEKVMPTFIESFGAGIMLLVFLAGTLLKKVHVSTRQIYIFSCLGLIMSMIFITPNFGGWNLQIFQILNDHVPFFSLFKNMFDKFSLAMSFHTAFALFLSLVIIDRGIKRKTLKYATLAVLASIVLIRAYPFIVPSYTHEQQKTHIYGSFNEDYKSLAAYISDMNTSSKFLWYPMTYPGYVYIEDGMMPNHWYVGISPLQILAKGSDIVGYEGIQTPIQPDLNKEILTLLSSHSFEKLGMLFREQNIGFVIVNHASLDPSYYDLFNNYDFIANQTGEYQRIILGEKIKDFGSRYSLYEINSRWKSSTMYISPATGDVSNVVSTATSFQKIKSGKYSATLENTSDIFELVLMEPFDRFWKIYLTNDNKRIETEMKPYPKYDYGNAWMIDSKDLYQRYPTFIHKNLDGSYSFALEIEFWPITVTPWGVGVSVLTLCLSIGYIGYRVCKKT